ncbi:hypothetical protein LTR86_006264 [Recurvomyces mirabilis]|nr:hypothetical protein LTR86_006264 [Recurvomyces mirabilis]
MPADDAPDDEDDRIRQSYNFAPGYHGLIYRAETSDRGGGQHDEENEAGEPSPKKAKHTHSTTHEVDGLATNETKYKLQAAKWGLIPFWTKRAPDYSSQLRTINCRDDSLAQSGGMWNTMKQRKRCIVVAEGFYEWLKKDGGKIKIPHFTKRKDGGLMCFAGLWDCVRYEGAEDKIYSYTIITTDSNQHLNFLHDRMPVIVEPGSEQMKAWLDPNRVGWDKELQSMLKPFQGELECYPVDQGVGKVGNNSPLFVVPVDSKENKKNIANFFGKQDEKAKVKEEKEDQVVETRLKKEDDALETSQFEESEGNAPLPKPVNESEERFEQGLKVEHGGVGDEEMVKAAGEIVEKDMKHEVDQVDDKAMLEAVEQEKNPTAAVSPAKRKAPSASPVKNTPASKRVRSATRNTPRTKTPDKEGNARITAFFGK